MGLKAIAGIMLTLLLASIIMVLVETASATPAVTQTNPETTVYLDPATIVGETVGQVFTVDLNIINAHEINGWESGLIFNATLLTCTGFIEGEFLSDEGFTSWTEGTIDNTKGEISLHICNMLGTQNASGNGRLAYLTFQVKETGVLDLHIRDLSVFKMEIPPMVPVNIIDVYTVLLDATPHTVVTVSNTTGSSPQYHSGFYGHAFSTPDKELSFNVTGPFPGFANVTIPKTLLKPEPSYGWGVIIDGSRLSAYETTVTENATHTSIYFTYTTGTHNVQITTRPPLEYTLKIYSLPAGVTFTVDGVSRTTPWSETCNESTPVSLEMPETHTVGGARYCWDQWSDGVASRSRTVTMDTNITLTGVFTLPVGGIWIPVNKLELLASYIGLTLIIILPLLVTVVLVKLGKEREKD